MKCIDNWKSALDKQHYIGALFMDLSKAFDCLQHGLIIAKLHAYGLELPVYNLLILICMEENSVLRFQIVEVHGQC